MKCYNHKCTYYELDKRNGCLLNKKGLNDCSNFIDNIEKEIKTMNTEFFQTPNSLETIAIIRDPDGSISIGIARAGRIDIENKRITTEDGMSIAEGRAVKAKGTKTTLCEKNYLRGIHALPVKITDSIQESLTDAINTKMNSDSIFAHVNIENSITEEYKKNCINPRE